MILPRRIKHSTDFFERVVFSIKCKVSLSGFVSKKNCLAWCTKRPNEVYQDPKNSSSVMVWYIKARNTWSLSFWTREFDTLRLPKTYYFSAEWCSSPLHRSFRSVFVPKVLKSLDEKSWHNFMPSSLTEFDTLWLLFMWSFENRCKPSSPNNSLDLKTKKSETIAFDKNNSIKCSKTGNIVYNLYGRKELRILNTYYT